MSHNGTVRCSYCHLTGHNRRKCNDLSGTYKRMYESAISRAKMYAADGETGKAENAAGSAADSRQQSGKIRTYKEREVWLLFGLWAYSQIMPKR